MSENNNNQNQNNQGGKVKGKPQSGGKPEQQKQDGSDQPNEPSERELLNSLLLKINELTEDQQSLKKELAQTKGELAAAKAPATSHDLTDDEKFLEQARQARGVGSVDTVDYDSMPAPSISFTGEIVDDRARQITINSIMQPRLRSRYDVQQIVRRKGGIRGIGERSSQVPLLPGLYLKVTWNSRERKVEIIDPLTFDSYKETVRRLDNALAGLPAAAPRGYKGKIRGLDPVTRELNVHEAKSLLRELTHLAKFDRFEIVSGALPSPEEIVSLPGRFLFDPLSISQTQPRFEDQRDRYYDRVQNMSF